MKLYSYWRSTTSYRVRVALNLKKIDYEYESIDLVAGAHKVDEYATLNPGKGVPTLQLDDGTLLTQSMAILDFLDAAYPKPQLVPEEPLLRAKTLAVAHAIALDIHPVNNLRVIGALKSEFGASADDAKAWMQRWMREGFAAIEAMLPAGKAFSFSNNPNIADLCIVAQAYNAHRWGVDLKDFPAIARIEKACLEIPEIMAAHPDNQPDAKEIT